MLFISLIDGLTVGNKMYQKGEVFEITEDNPAWKSCTLSEDMTEEELLATFQGGTELFRKPTATDLRNAFSEGLIVLDMMDDTQKKLINEAIKGKISEVKRVSESLTEQVKKLEKDAPKPEQVVQEGSESVPVEEKK